MMSDSSVNYARGANLSEFNKYSTEILEASVEFVHQPFIKPLILSSGSISEITEARAKVTVRVNGKEATGSGSIYLSDLWAWPDPALTHDERDAKLREECQYIADNLRALCGEAAHPLELGMQLHEARCHAQHGAEADGHAAATTVSDMPILARAVCVSPFDAAIHDAVGQALQVSAFSLYDEATSFPSVDRYFASGSACNAIQAALGAPTSHLNAWLIIGAKDSIEIDVAPWVQERGYHCFKLKLLARDNAEDVARTVEAFRGIRGLGVAKPRFSVDTNEANPDAASVLDYLEQLRAADAEAFEALEYLEQPTGRDITKNAYDWSAVTQLKPVLLDEGLTSLDLLKEAAAQGWSGLALKTCKGHSFTLVAAAWARANGMILAMQDLTNPGIAAIHSALFAAYFSSCNGVELNSPQYTPAANAPWLPRMQEFFEPRDGRHKVPSPEAPGLGSTL
jgi:L-alanine-DL-glutamate epimerase-like enolase superfamily enzyme